MIVERKKQGVKAPSREGILLCSDLDRTIIPNGPQAESPRARELLGILAGRPEMVVVYVSGRHRELLMQAIRHYALPLPDYAVGDVGTTIYHLDNSQWRQLQAWHEEIAEDWLGLSSRNLAPMLGNLKDLRLQEEEKQGPFKLSYYTLPYTGGRGGAAGGESARDKLLSEVEFCLREARIHLRLVWSVDEERNLGLLDILPERAGKLAAIRFLMNNLGFSQKNTVFSGDSGNDLDVLGSELNAVLVANAPEEVRREAREMVRRAGRDATLYCARGGFMGMNGNYSAGVLEGLAHYQPKIGRWLQPRE